MNLMQRIPKSMEVLCMVTNNIMLLLQGITRPLDWGASQDGDNVKKKGGGGETFSSQAANSPAICLQVPDFNKNAHHKC